MPPLLRRLFVITVTALGLVAGTSTSASASGATSPEFFGTNTGPLQLEGAIPAAKWGQWLQPLADGKMVLQRVLIPWYQYEPNAPVKGVHKYDWTTDSIRTSMDFTMLTLAKYGLRAVPTFSGAPTWAGGPGTTMTEDRFDDFAAFVIAYTQRYGPGGTFWAAHPEVKAEPVTDLELWNEANTNNSWTRTSDPAAYARFLNRIAPQIRAAAPKVRLMASLGWPDASTYLSSLYQFGAGPSIDAVAFHPYAPTVPAILGLVSGLRATLASVGKPDLPILVTESGQPANYDGTGARYAYAGAVNDASRAATQSLIGEALAHSDCNVQAFLVFAIIGSETQREQLSEGYMGILRHADGTPNVTGQALQRASQRWAATGASDGLLNVCNPGVTPPAALRPLGLGAQRGSSGGCVAGAVNFDGNPIEQVDLVLTTPDGRVSTNATDASGQTESCVPAGPRITYVDVYAELRNVARSPTVRCDIPVTNCGLPITPPSPPPCTVVLKTTRPVLDRVGKRAKSQGSAKLSCRGYLTRKTVKVKVLLKGKTKAGKRQYRIKNVTRVIQPRFALSYRAKGKKRETRLRYITLNHTYTVRFQLHRVIRKGDQLAIVHVPNPKLDKLPRVRVVTTMPKPKAAPKTKKKASAKTKATAKK